MSIGRAADHLGVSVETLRYYEAQGLVEPERTTSGHRVYLQRALDALHVVCAMRAAGLSMAQVRALIAAKTDDPAAVRVAQARAALAAIDDELEARQHAIARARDLTRGWLAQLEGTGL